MTLTATEFLRRFFLHVLPKGFVRIRHFGFLGNRFRVARVKLCRQLLANAPLPPAPRRFPRRRRRHLALSPLWHGDDHHPAIRQLNDHFQYSYFDSS